MKKILFTVLLFATVISAVAQKPGGGGRESGKKMEGQRKYTITVHEADGEQIKVLNRGLEVAEEQQRSLLTDLAGMYRSTLTGQAISATTSFLELGINAIRNATRDKQPEWEKAVRNESKFVRQLPMQTEIVDFYKSPSTKGPLDPTDMLFNGFGCRQVIEYRDEDGQPQELEVFKLRCKVRTDTAGIARMLNHSKFEVYVDELTFNPYLCDLPNDSLGLESDKRIDFSFAKRNNLKFNVNAIITSSWINQAMQVFNNEKLGEFTIVADIDPTLLNENGMFEYIHDRDKDSGKRVSVTGDCFLVPRSYVGSSDMKEANDSWGTGQYRVDMNVTESCQINKKYYTDENGKWKKDRWKPEWELIKKRKRSPNVWQQILNIVGVGYLNGEWVTTLTDPVKTYIIQTETGWFNSGSGSAPAAKSAAGAGAGAGGAGAPGGKTSTR